MSETIALGIDIGGTNTKFAPVTQAGEINQLFSISTTDFTTPNELLAEINKTVADKYPDKKIIGVGIGAPNASYLSGYIEQAPNLNWGQKVNLKAIAEQVFGVPTWLTNDANAAALGEMMFGAAKGMRDFIVITLGTGLGSGIVTNGELVYGHDGFAGELGHTTVKPDGRQCACGRRGCLETYASATGITRTVYKFLADSIANSRMREVSFNQLSANMITDAVIDGDPIAIEAFEYTGMFLGIKLADAVAYLSPQAIFLTGGLARAGKYIFEPTKKHMEAHLLPIYRNKIQILPSGLTTNPAVLGAGALVWKEMKPE